MQIHKMTIDDYDDVYCLWINTPGMGLNNLYDSRQGIDNFLKRNPNSCFVAMENAKLIGVILSGHDGRRGFIYHTAVDVSQRNNGVGRKLVEAALNALQEEGINKVAFVVFKKNEIGNAFWEKLGFGERTDLVYRNKGISNTEMIRLDI